ncbi:MAG: hypothetical protein ACTSRG_12430 [Candidatus Helarchaeota archaeon]
MTSVTIPEELRKKLKKLAAKYDTTQGKIIEMALNLMENKMVEKITEKNKKVEKILKEISQKIRKNDQELNKRREKLEKKGISIEDVIGYSWGVDFEDFNR